MKIFNIIKNKKGSVSVLNLLTITSLIAASAFAIDYGVGAVLEAKLQNAVDAATLAGGLYLYKSEADAYNKAQEVALANGVSADEINIQIDGENKKVTVGAARGFTTALATIVGISDGIADTDAAARLAPIGKVKKGIRPLAVEDQTLFYGQRVILKLNASDNEFGNFGALSLGGTGASVYLSNLLYGYDGELSVGDIVYTNPGNMASIINPVRNMINSIPETFDNFDRDSLRLWVVPVVDSMDVNGSYPVMVVGFAVFFIEDIGVQSGQTSITGRFVKFAVTGEQNESAKDFGFDAVKLIK